MSVFPIIEVSGATVIKLVAVVSVNKVLAVVQACTTEGKLEALQRVVKKAREEHDTVVNEVLRSLPKKYAEELLEVPEFKEAFGARMLLDNLASRVKELELQVQAAGVWSWTPTVISDEITMLTGRLEVAYKNILTTTKKARDAALRGYDAPLPMGSNRSEPSNPTPVPIVDTSPGRI